MSSDLRSFLGHSRNYVFAELINKGLLLLSILIFTRLLAPDEYGHYAIFQSVLPLCITLYMLGSSGSLLRFKTEAPKEFNAYFTTSLVAVLLFGTLLFIITLVFADSIVAISGLARMVVLYAAGSAVLFAGVRVVQASQMALKQSKEYILLSLLEYIGLFLLSVILVLNATTQRYEAILHAYAFIALLIFVIALWAVRSQIDFRLKKTYVLYALAFGVPLIPHMLSGYVLSSFDKIIINQLEGSVNTGLYAMAYNIGMVLHIINMAMNKSWLPVFYEKLEERNYSDINSLSKGYGTIMFVIAAFLVIFHQELGRLLVPREYYAGIGIIPTVVLGYFTLFGYTLYANYSFYRKKTLRISIATVISGALNVFLNYWLIPVYGFHVAAFTTLASYIVLFAFHYINARYYMQDLKVIPVILFLRNFAFLVMFSVGVHFVIQFEHGTSWFLILMAKVMLFSLIIAINFKRMLDVKNRYFPV